MPTSGPVAMVVQTKVQLWTRLPVEVTAKGASLCLVLILLGGSPRVLAEEPASASVGSGADLATWLQFDGCSCADANALMRRVSQRSKRVHFGEVGAQSRVVVRVTRRDVDSWQADVRFSGLDREVEDRILESRSCLELVDAAGFVIAMTLDPPRLEEAGGERSLPSANRGATQAAESSPVKAGGAASARAPAGSQGARRATKLGERDPNQASKGTGRSGEAEKGSKGALLLGIHTTSSAAPSPIWGPLVGWAYGYHPPDNGLTFRPRLRLTGQYARGGGFGGEAGQVTFELVDVSLDLCPSQIGFQGAGLALCLEATGGGLRGVGERALNRRSRTRPWGVIGAAILLELPLTSPWLVWFSGGGGITLVRDRFMLTPQLVHAVPPWCASATGGLGFELP